MLSAGSEFSYVAAIYPNKKRQHFLSLTPLLPSNDAPFCAGLERILFLEKPMKLVKK